MLTQRQQKLNRLFRKEISDLLIRHMKDPRLEHVLISEVQISPDLAQAMVYVVISGGEEARAKSMEGLARAAGYIRSQLGKRLRLRRIPQLEFLPDLAQERGDRLLDLMNKVRQELDDNEHKSKRNEDE